MAKEQTVTEVDLAERANIKTEAEKKASEVAIEGLISFDQLVMNFLQQHHDTLEEYHKLQEALDNICLLYTSPSPRDVEESRMPSSA